MREGKVLVAVEPRGERRDERLAAAEVVLARAGAEPIPLPRG